MNPSRLSESAARDAAPPEAPDVQPRPQPMVGASPRRILVAEDEHLVAASIVLSLAELGYTTLGPVPDGQRAVELARVSLPDLALVDVRMPRKDGIEAAEELFGELAVPVVIVSAYSDGGQVAAASRAGVFGYLVKPVETEQLRAAIEVAWSRYAQLMDSQRENSDLRRRLSERRTIESAKWALVELGSLTEPEAMNLLRKRARDSGRTMIEIALEVLRQRQGK